MNEISLNFKRASEYFKDHIMSGNTLSALILKKTDFTKGHFFTLMPDNANLNQIEDFKSGGILPPVGPIIKFPNGKGSYQLIPNASKLLAEFIKSYLLIDSSNLCIAEDVICRPSDKEIKETNLYYSTYHEEIYYFLNKDSKYKEIKNVIQQVNAIYHLLIILTHDKYKTELKLNEKKFDELINNINFIICGAYDGEGYIIWEKNDRSK